MNHHNTELGKFVTLCITSTFILLTVFITLYNIVVKVC